MERLELHIESIVFASDKPVKLQEICDCLEKMNADPVPEDLVVGALRAIDEKYKADGFAMHIVKSGGGYQFLTKPEFHETVAELLHQSARRKLTNAALETLSIIAYKQPVSKSEIEKIRGVNSDYTVNKLMEKELVEIVGRSEDVGKALLYGTSAFFMDYFGINSIEDLPKIKEFTDTENQIGVLPDIDQPSEN